MRNFLGMSGVLLLSLAFPLVAQAENRPGFQFPSYKSGAELDRLNDAAKKVQGQIDDLQTRVNAEVGQLQEIRNKLPDQSQPNTFPNQALENQFRTLTRSVEDNRSRISRLAERLGAINSDIHNAGGTIRIPKVVAEFLKPKTSVKSTAGRALRANAIMAAPALIEHTATAAQRAKDLADPTKFLILLKASPVDGLRLYFSLTEEERGKVLGLPGLRVGLEEAKGKVARQLKLRNFGCLKDNTGGLGLWSVQAEIGGELFASQVKMKPPQVRISHTDPKDQSKAFEATFKPGVNITWRAAAAAQQESMLWASMETLGDDNFKKADSEQTRSYLLAAKDLQERLQLLNQPLEPNSRFENGCMNDEISKILERSPVQNASVNQDETSTGMTGISGR